MLAQREGETGLLLYRSSTLRNALPDIKQEVLMEQDIVRFYRALGYEEFVPVEPEAEEMDAAAGLAFSGVAAEAAGEEPARGELSPLGPAEIEELQRQFEQDPEAVVAWYRQTWDADITEEDVRAALAQAEMAFRAPDAAAAALEAQLAFSRAPQLPPEFTFPDMDLDLIPIEPGLTKFETVADALGWLLFSGPQFVLGGLLSRAPFRWHNHPEHSSGFVYEMENPTPETPVDVALFSDFGTGLYHSRYIARQLERHQFPCAVHLGDVYYAGRRSEFRDHFEQPLNPVLEHTELFTLNANHEMLSGAFPYFDYMDRRRTRDNQRQEGSYFCLRCDRFQLVGIDGAYFEQGRYREAGLLEWLEKVLSAGRREGRLNILLSPDQAYEYGKVGPTPILTEDLHRLVLEKELVDLWFWGNTHYCALFDRSPDFPFLASCIGHGGYPYSRIRPNRPSPAPLIFLETSPRFPEWTGVRQDRGNNGYCILSLKADGGLALTYIDWMGNRRFRAELARDGDGRLEVAEAVLG